VNDLKVVVSGNAGGFNADNSIKGEFHIEVNGPTTTSPISALTGRLRAGRCQAY
jgi:hypothetical protein